MTSRFPKEFGERDRVGTFAEHLHAVPDEDLQFQVVVFPSRHGVKTAN